MGPEFDASSDSDIPKNVPFTLVINTLLNLAMIGSGIASRDTEDQVPTTVLRSCMYKKICRLLSWMGSQIHGGPGTELAGP